MSDDPIPTLLLLYTLSLFCVFYLFIWVSRDWSDQTSYIRHQISDIRHQTSDDGRLLHLLVSLSSKKPLKKKKKTQLIFPKDALWFFNNFESVINTYLHLTFFFFSLSFFLGFCFHSDSWLSGLILVSVWKKIIFFLYR